jgi:hypothetical protein
MSDKRLNIHCAWWLRPETVLETVERINETFDRLASLHPSWRSWYWPHDYIVQSAEPERLLSGNKQFIRQALVCSRENEQTGEPGLDSAPLGYSMIASSEPRGEGAIQRTHFNLHCCSRNRYSGFNTLAVRLPEQIILPSLYDLERICQAAIVLQAVWDPDWIAVWDFTTHLTPGPWPPRPAFGWVNYLASRVGIIAGLPEGWRWYGEGNGQRLFIHCAGPPDASNPHHVVAFRRMAENIRWAEDK